MNVAKKFRPISYLKTNTADVAKELQDEAGAIVITQNGIPSFVCVSFDEYYQSQETNALLKIVNMGQQQIERGNFKPLAEAKAALDKRILGKRTKS